jgi:hypothetical protein
MPRRALLAVVAAAAGASAAPAPATAAAAREAQAAPTVCRVSYPPARTTGVARAAPDVAPAFRSCKSRRRRGGGGSAHGGGGDSNGGGSNWNSGGNNGGGGDDRWWEGPQSGDDDSLLMWHTLCALSLAAGLHHFALRCTVRTVFCFGGGLFSRHPCARSQRRGPDACLALSASPQGAAQPCLASCSSTAFRAAPPVAAA